jgi:hypothetical protein
LPAESRIHNYLLNIQKIIEIKDPRVIVTLLEDLELVLSISVKVSKGQAPDDDLYKDLGRDGVLSLCIQAIQLLSDVKSSQLIRDLFWGYEHLVELVVNLPNPDLKIIYKVL